VSYRLYLDDERLPKESFRTWGDPDYDRLDWTVVRSHHEFVKTVEARGLPELVSFDHDLDEEHYAALQRGMTHEGFRKADFKVPTGYISALWLVQYCWKHSLALPRYKTHTLNPYGRDIILEVLGNYFT